MPAPEGCHGPIAAPSGTAAPRAASRRSRARAGRVGRTARRSARWPWESGARRGEAGIGKSALISALAWDALDRGALVLTGNCYDLTTTPAYGPWIEVTRAYPADADLPALPDQFTTEGGMASLDSQAALFDLIRRFLIRVATVRPFVVLLEDLHWADPASIDLLRSVARAVQEQPILVAATYRDDEVAQSHPFFRLLPTLIRETPAHRLLLHRFDRAATLALTREHYVVAGDDEMRLVTYLERLAEGNPFFTLEILHTLIEQRLLSPAGGAWKVGDLVAAGVSPLIQQIISDRLAPLNTATRQLLDLAAVIGNDVQLDLLRSLFPGTAAELDDALRHALERHLLHLQADHQAIRFNHALVRQTIYEAITPLRRQRLHRQAGELLGGRGRPDLNAVSDHLYQAGDARAIDWLIRAAEQAQSVFAPQTVITRCQQVVELAGRLGQAPPVAAYRLLGLARETSGDLGGAREAHDAALALAQDMGDQRAVWQALLDLGNIWTARDYGQSTAYFEQALELARDIGDPAFVAQSLNRLGNWYVNVERPDQGLVNHQEALEIFEGIGDRAGIAATYDLMGMAYLVAGDSVRSADYYGRAIPLLRSLDNRQTLVTALVISSYVRFGTVHVLFGSRIQQWQPGAQRDRFVAIDEATQITRDIGWRTGEAFCLALSARAARIFGDYGRALRDGQASVQIANDIGHRQWLVLALCSLGAAHADLFDEDQALKYYQRAHGVAEQTLSRVQMSIATTSLASMHIARGNPDQAEALIEPLDTFQSPTTSSQRNYWFVKVELELAKGNVSEALGLLDQLEASLPHHSEQRAPGLQLLRGVALMAGGRGAEAETVLLAARQSADRFGYRSTAWQVLVSLRKLYLQQGSLEEAETVRQAALAIIDELAAGLEDDELRERFQAGARSRLPVSLPFRAERSAGSSFGGLTEREHEVLVFVAQGMTDLEISRRLFISPRTVNAHLRSIYGKLEVTNRTSAVRRAIDHGLV